jgi:outer membrane protein TolC
MRLLILAASLAAFSATAANLTLQEAMARARADAPEAAAARLRQQAAEARRTQAAGFRLPSLSLSETFLRTNSPAEAFAMKLNQERFSFADFTQSDPNSPAPLSTAITRAELSVPLFTGGELSGRIAQAASAAAAAERTAAWAGDSAALTAGLSFVQLAQAREYAGLLGHAKETVAAHVALARQYVEQGMLVRSELLRAEVELARTEDLLAEAEGNARVAAAALAFRTGATAPGPWDLAPLPAPPPLPEGSDPWLASASSRPDYLAVQKMLEAGEREVKVKRAGFLPKVGAMARGDLVDDTLFGAHGRSWTLMAFASINLFSGGSDRAAVAAARADAEAGRKDVGRMAEGIRLEVRKAYEAARTARARHATALLAVGAARENERILGERFRSGVVKMLDLLDAETALRETETRELSARAESHAALLRLAVSAGRSPESVLPADADQGAAR